MIELAPDVSMTILASEVVSELPTPEFGGWALTFEQLSLEPGANAVESTAVDPRIQLLYVDDGEFALRDDGGETVLAAGEQLHRTSETGYEVRNTTGRCGSLLRLTALVGRGAGAFDASVSGPALPTVACKPAMPSVHWLAGVDDVPEPVRLFVARVTLGPNYFSAWESGFAGPVLLLVESGTPTIDRAEERYYLAAGSVVLMWPGTVRQIANRSGERATALVAGVIPTGQALAQPTAEASVPVVAEPDPGGVVDLADLLPTEEQMPPGLVMTQDLQRTLAEVAANYGDPDETQRLFAAWGWQGNVARWFAAPGGQEVAPDAASSVYVSIHRFGSASAAAQALAYSFEQQLATTAAQEVPIEPVGDGARALVATGPDATEVTIYTHRGGLLIRLSAASQAGDPTADALAIVETILAGVR